MARACVRVILRFEDGSLVSCPTTFTKRQALSMRWPVLMPFAVAAHQFARVLRDAHDVATERVRFASHTQSQRLLHHVKKHQSRLMRQVVDDNRWLQHGKVQNLRVAVPLLDGATVQRRQACSWLVGG